MRLIIIFVLLFNNAISVADNSPFYRNQKTSPILKQEGSFFSINATNILAIKLLRLLADAKHVNLATSNEIKSRLSLNLYKVTWDQAFNTVLDIANLTKRRVKNILMIYPKNLKDMPRQLFILHYLDAKKVADMLRDGKNILLSKNGYITVDSRNNRLWVRDKIGKLKAIHKLLKQMDTPLRQISIDARIVSIDRDNLKKFGLRFGKTGQLQLAIAPLNRSTTLDLELTALEQSGHGKLIASPHLITQNRKAAYIESGEAIPYQEKTSSGATNVAFKKAVMGLSVTPIVAGKYILLKININQNRLSDRLVKGVPGIQTRELNTQALVGDGQTIVLGGVFEDDVRWQITGVPLISQLPILGRLFQYHQITHQRRELFIFIRPKMMNGTIT